MNHAALAATVHTLAHHHRFHGFVGVLVLLVIVVGGGYYLWQRRRRPPPVREDSGRWGS